MEIIISYFAVKVISLNVNGIRSSYQKGLFNWLKEANADIICLQETRFQALSDQLKEFQLENYYSYFFNAEKKGYSGVAIYSRYKPLSVSYGLNFDLANTEGRYLEIELEHCQVTSIYIPSGASGELKQQNKFSFMADYLAHLSQPQKDKPYIICGDWNIAHQIIDLKNWKGNQKNSGFLPEERAWLDSVLGCGYVDGFRKINTQPEEYTWWKTLAAKEKNIGWRIDYQMVDHQLSHTIRSARIDAEVYLSDHAPVIIDYDIE